MQSLVLFPYIEDERSLVYLHSNEWNGSVSTKLFQILWGIFLYRTQLPQCLMDQSLKCLVREPRRRTVILKKRKQKSDVKEFGPKGHGRRVSFSRFVGVRK